MNRLARAICLSSFVLSVAASPVFSDGVAVRGRVVGASGAPLAEAAVSLVEAGDPVTDVRARLGEIERGVVAEARTGPDGLFRIDAPGAGAYTIRVEAPGHAPLERRVVPLVEPADLSDAELSSEGKLTVRVLGDDDTPVAGAIVRLAPPPRRGPAFGAQWAWNTPPALARTGADGAATLVRGPARRLQVTASAPGFAVTRSRVAGGDTLTVRLARGSGRTVVVRDAGGRPVPGALVGAGENDHPVGLTDEDGRVVLTLAGAVTTPVTVRAGDARETSRRVTAPAEGDGEPLVVTLPAAVEIMGRVVDEDTGRGIEGAVVWERERPWRVAGSERAGAFRLVATDEGSVEIAAAAPGYLPSPATRTSADLHALAPPTIALRPAAAIEGIVVGETGRPVAGARLTMEEQLARSGRMVIRIGDDMSGPTRAMSGPDGRFRLAPVDPEKRWTVIARSADRPPARADVPGLAPRETSSGVRLELSPGFELSGLVVDESEAPVRGATVEVVAAQERGGPGMMMMIPGGGGLAEKLTADSDGDGRFRAPGLAAGEYDVTVTREGFASAKLPGLEVSGESAAVDAGTIRLQHGFTLQGRVVDELGEPLSGVAVTAQAAGGGFMMALPGAPEGEPDALTTPDGWFTVSGLGRGERVSVTLSRTGYVRASVPNIEIPANASLDVTMSSSSKVAGVVLDPEGRPVPGATVNLDREMSASMGGREMVMMMREGAETDATGAFEFDDLEPSEIGLEATAFGFGRVSRTMRIPKGEDLLGVELPLGEGAVIAGRVLRSDGRPAVGARVGPVTDQPHMLEMEGASTDGDGRYVLDGITPGTLSVQAVSDSGQRDVREIEARAGVSTLDLRFEGGNDVSGVVMNQSGAAVAGAWVRLARPGQPWSGPEETSATDGGFSFEGILDGEYELVAGHDAYAPSSAEDRAVIVAGEPLAGLEVRLQSGASLAGTVTGLPEETYSRVNVMAGAIAGTDFRDLRVDHRGTFRAENLSPGRWFLRGQVDGEGRQARAEVTIEPGDTDVPVELAFGQGLVLSGVARRDGSPLPGATLYAEGLDVSSSGWSQTDNEGRFALDGLTAGRHLLSLREWKSGLSYSEEVALDGDREIELEIPTALIRGVVVDSAGDDPLAGVRVWLGGEGADAGPLSTLATTTDLDGRFVLTPVTDGSWQLSASKSGFAVKRSPVEVSGSRSVEDFKIRLDPTEGITLLVRLAAGGIPERVTLAILDASAGVLTSGSYATGEGGKLRVGSVPQGTWEVVLSAPGAATTSLAVASPSAANAVELPPPSRLAVRVPELAEDTTAARLTVASDDGRPFRGLSFHGNPVTEWRLLRGQATVDELPPGRWRVDVSASDGRRWQGVATTSNGSTAELELE